MPGESPLSMMQPRRQRPRRYPDAAAPPRRRRLWPVVLPVCVVIVLAAVWCGLWYYAAGIADRTMSGWMAREAAAGGMSHQHETGLRISLTNDGDKVAEIVVDLADVVDIATPSRQALPSNIGHEGRHICLRQRGTKHRQIQTRAA